MGNLHHMYDINNNSHIVYACITVKDHPFNKTIIYILDLYIIVHIVYLYHRTIFLLPFEGP